MNTQIDPAAPAVTRQSRTVAGTPEQVFAVITDIEGWPRWQPEVTRATVRGPLEVGTTFTWRSGVPIRSTVTVLDPNRAITWTGRTVGTRAVHSWTLEAVDGGTLVRTEESMDGWLPRLATRTVQRTLERGVTAVLDALATTVTR